MARNKVRNAVNIGLCVFWIFAYIYRQESKTVMQITTHYPFFFINKHFNFFPFLESWGGGDLFALRPLGYCTSTIYGVNYRKFTMRCHDLLEKRLHKCLRSRITYIWDGSWAAWTRFNHSGFIWPNSEIPATPYNPYQYNQSSDLNIYANQEVYKIKLWTTWWWNERTNGK